MSTSTHIESSCFCRIPIGRRIAELMQERGEAFSIRAFSARIGMNRETLRLLLTEERQITLSALEKISNGLGISEERLRQMDTFGMERELDTFFRATKRTKTMMMRARAIATELANVAKGATERGYSLNNLGRVQYLQNQYDEAHESWLSALQHANKLYEQYNDKSLLHLVTSKLMMTYTIRKEYSNIEEFLHVVEDVFADDPLKLGMAQYTRMKVQEEKGNLERAKEHAYRSFEHLEQTDSSEQVSHGLINIAHYEYRLGNYNRSAQMLSKAIAAAQLYDNILILAVKEYVKSLIQIKDCQTAAQVIRDYSDLAKEYPEHWGKLQIMNTMAQDDASFAKTVLNNPDISPSVRYYASKCLMEYYFRKGDAETSMRYYEKSLIYSSRKSEILTEEGF